MDDPAVLSAISRLRGTCDSHSSESGTDAKQLLAVKDGHTFLWNGATSTILVVALGDDLQGDERIQTFSLTDSPSYDVERMVVSHSGRWIALYGPRGVTCVDLPRRSGRQGRYSGGQSEVTCRSTGVAERFFLCQSKILIQEVQFHPGSHYDNHVVVLASDNYLRIYDIDTDSQTPEQSYSLAAGSGASNSHFFAEAPVTVQGSLGEAAVGFTFAPAISTADEEGDDPAPNLYPLFLLHGNGNVFCLVTGLGENRPRNPRVLGPLSMLPPSDSNYGSESCSILCLHPFISSPPVLVIADNRGNLNHCVVLTQPAQGLEDDVRSQVSEWSANTFGAAQEADLSLYVYETVELELGVGGAIGEEKQDKNKDAPFEYPILLHPDLTSPARYFCSHKAGVHCVGLPMVTELARLAQIPDGNNQLLDQFPRPEQSVVEHLVCTQMSRLSKSAPVLGVAMHYPPTTLICLLNDHSLQTLSLSPPYFSAPPPLLLKHERTEATSGRPSSPLKSRGEPFEQRIKAILHKSSKHPLIRAGANGNDLSKQECLEILTRSTQILRDEYLVRLERARVDIERRGTHLEAQKGTQRRSLARLGAERETLRGKAADLAERYEDLRDSGDGLTSRIEIVLQKIQRMQPMGSEAEIKMQRTLQDIERKSHDLRNALEQVKSKERYQLKQIQQAKSNVARRAEIVSGMGDNQLGAIKDVLEQDSKDISELVDKVQIAKRDLAA